MSRLSLLDRFHPKTNPNIKNEEILNNLYRDEEEELKKYNTKENGIVLVNIDNIDSQLMKEFITNHWDAPNFQDFLGYLYKIITAYSYIANDQSEVFRYYNRINKILGAGVQGTVATSSFDGVTNESAIKTAKDSNDNYDIMKEYFIGTELNKFRNPVFVHTYALYKCNTIVEYLKDPINFCQNTKNNALDLQVLNGTPSRKFNHTPDGFNKVLLIILSALEQTKSIGFTHYDLHDENVFIINKYGSYQLSFKNTYYIDVDYFPIIIDYGFARAETQYGSIYKTEFEDYNIIDKYRPMYDFYKYMMFSVFIQFNNLYRAVKPLILFFHPDWYSFSDQQVYNMMNELNENYFVVPDQYVDISVQDFMNSNGQHFKRYLNSNNGQKYIIGSDINVDFLATFGLLDDPIVDNTFEEEVLINTGNAIGYSDEMIDQDREYIKYIVNDNISILRSRFNNSDQEDFVTIYLKSLDEYKTVKDIFDRLKMINPSYVTGINLNEYKRLLERWETVYNNILLDQEKMAKEAKRTGREFTKSVPRSPLSPSRLSSR